MSDYVSWRGTLDFAVHFLPFDYWDVGGKGLLPSLGGMTTSGYTWAAEEALTGVDANGDAPDIGCYILPNVDGRLTNYDVPLSFDGSPDFYEAYVPPLKHMILLQFSYTKSCTLWRFGRTHNMAINTRERCLTN